MLTTVRAALRFCFLCLLLLLNRILTTFAEGITSTFAASHATSSPIHSSSAIASSSRSSSRSSLARLIFLHSFPYPRVRSGSIFHTKDKRTSLYLSLYNTLAHQQIQLLSDKVQATASCSNSCSAISSPTHLRINVSRESFSCKCVSQFIPSFQIPLFFMDHSQDHAHYSHDVLHNVVMQLFAHIMSA